MRRSVGGWIFACCVVCGAWGAHASNLSGALRNFYAEYEIVLQCQAQAQVTAADADAAKSAIAAIERYYLQKDAKIDKASVKKQATADKNEGFRILARSGKGGLRPYCQVSLNDLLAKAEEVAPKSASE
jgi:hypothetical protein